MPQHALQTRHVVAVPCGEDEVPVARYTCVAQYPYDLLSAPSDLAGSLVEDWQADSNSRERTIWFKLSSGRYAYANQRVDTPTRLDLYISSLRTRHGRTIVSFADLDAVARALAIEVQSHTWIAHADIAEFIEHAKRLPPGAAAWYNGQMDTLTSQGVGLNVSRGGSAGGRGAEKQIDPHYLALAKRYGSPALQLLHSREPSRSHLCGVPSLPKNLAWPQRDGRPLNFLMRLSIAEMQKATKVDWLPTKGALLFFFDFEAEIYGHDPAHASRWAVLYVPDLLRPVQRGAAVDAPISLKATKFISVPSIERLRYLAPSLATPEPEVWQQLCEDAFGRRKKHQVGGFPYVLQADNMQQMACELMLDAPETAAEWELLLQLDTGVHRNCPDVGMLYFWVKSQRAAVGDFDSVVCFRQRD